MVSSCSRVVVYRRGRRECAWHATAAPLQSPIDSSADSIDVSWNKKDYIGPIAELRAFFGVTFLPEEQDVVIDTINGFAVSHEIRRDESEKPYLFCDAEQTRVRIHSFEISRVAL